MSRSRLLALVLLTAASCGGGGDKPATTAGTDAGTSPSSKAPSATVEPAAQGKPFEIVESATNVSPSVLGGQFYVQWIAVMRNPNPDLFGAFPTVAVTARDAQGAVVGTDDQVMESLPPGATIAFASQVTATAQPAKIDITFKKVDWVKTQTKPADYPPFTAEKVSFRPDRAAGFSVTGDLRNPYSKPVDGLAVTALVRDAAGKLLGGRTTFLDTLAAGGTIPFSFTSGAVQGTGAKVDIMAMPWGGAPNTWNKLAMP